MEHGKQEKVRDDWTTERDAIAGKLSAAGEALTKAKEAQSKTEGELSTLETELTSRKAAVAEALAQ